MGNRHAAHMPRAEMHAWRNYLAHGAFVSLYAFVKFLAFPFCNYLRFFILRLFTSDIHTAHIEDAVTLWFPWRIHIGRKSSLNHGVIIDGSGEVFIGEGVRIAAYTMINSADHAYDNPDQWIVDQGFKVAPIHIEDDVWIGAAVQIMKGVTIGKGSVIGAGAVVTKDVPPYSVGVGNPCRVIGRRKHD